MLGGFWLLSIKLVASCCSGASFSGIGRLKSHERAYISFINDAHRVLGHFDDQARFSFGYHKTLPHWRMNHELQAMVRLLDVFNPFIKLQSRTQLSELRVGSNVGDMSLGALAPLLDEGYFVHMPSLRLAGSIKIPTGVKNSLGEEAENITSMGFYEVALGFMMEKTLGPTTMSLAYGTTFFPLGDDNGFKPGINHNLSAHMSFSPHQSGSLQVAVATTFFGPASIDNVSINGSSAHQVMLSTHYAINFHSHLTASLGVGTHVPFNYMGKRSEADIYASFGLRVGVF